MNKYALSFIFLIWSVFSFAQVNPTPQALPFSQDFSGLLYNSDIYPDGFTGWRMNAAPTTEYCIDPPDYHAGLTASGKASTPTAAIHNYRGKIGLLDPNSWTFAIVFALDTSGKQNILLKYDIMTIRNPYGSESNNHINGATLQYRIGTGGSFTNLAGLEYQNNTTAQTGTTTAPQNPVSRSVVLAAACNNQSVVQIRLVSRLISGSGAYRPSFAIDNIVVTGEDIPTLPVELSSFTATISAQNYITLTWVTQSETNMRGYYVFRAGNNQISGAEIVSPMIAATNSSQQQTYAFTDTDIYESGTYYYWLQTNDIDGTVDFHGPVSVFYNAMGDNPTPEIPLVTELKSVYPNPFNPLAFIPFSLAKESTVSFKIYNTRGQIVKDYELGSKASGNYRITWDGTDYNGQVMANGVYYIMMNAGTQVYQTKAILLK